MGHTGVNATTTPERADLDPLLDVIHEDDDLLVVNKPAGLVCHPSKDGERSSLIGRVRLHWGDAEGRLVNRLDRETSGVVIVARSAPVARELGQLLAQGAIAKRYLAVVHGRVGPASFSIEAPLGADDRSEVAIKDCVREDGAAARTDVQLVRTFERDGSSFSVLDVTPKTGRKHQIRIHLAHAGHPIVGDKIYGGDERIYLRFVTRQLTDDDRRVLVVGNHALHAAQVRFSWRGRDWAFEAVPGDELRAFAAL